MTDQPVQSTQAPPDKAIDQGFADLDMFALLGVEDLPPEQKADRLLEIQEIVLADFFVNDISGILTDTQKQEIEQMHSGGKSQEDILSRLREMIPDIDDRIFKKTLAFKKDFVLGHLRFKLDIGAKEKGLLDKGDYPGEDLGLGQKVAELEKVEHDRATLAKALELYEQEKWLEGMGLLRQRRKDQQQSVDSQKHSER